MSGSTSFLRPGAPAPASLRAWFGAPALALGGIDRSTLLRKAPAAALLGVVLALWVLAAINLNFASPARMSAAPAQAIAAGAAPPMVAPESDPNALAQVSAEDAVKANAEIPVDTGPNPAAASFRLAADEIARMRSVDCLTAAIYYEAAMEPVDGQRAVAQVVLNRVRHPAWPNSVCGVVFQGHQRVTGCQFSFTCDGSLRRTPVPSIWSRVRRVAEAALAGYVHRPVGLATHYHANYVLPYWASSLAKIGQVGAHIFYRWEGGWGRPGAFAARYVGVEPAIAWRGGFGQPERATLAAAGTVPVDARDAAAAQAAAAAASATPHSVDSFQRAVLRRYEPVNRDNATRLIEQRNAATGAATTPSNRWALTGRPAAGAATQRPLGRTDGNQAAPPVELDGVRRRAPGSNNAPASLNNIAPAGDSR